MLGERVAALRRAAGMNQKDLAQRLRISTSAVGMYEQERREPSLETLAALSEVFGVSIDYLVTGRPSTELEEQKITALLLERVNADHAALELRRSRPFSRQEMAVLFAAMLMEP